MAGAFLDALCAVAFCVSCIRGADIEPKTVRSVDILGAPAAIKLETRVGDLMDSSKVRHDVKALWASRRVADVRVEVIDRGDTVGIVFRLKEKPSLLLNRVQVTPPTPEVDPTLKLPLRSPIDAMRAHEVAAGVRTHLVNNGFPDAKVEATLLPAGPGLTNLRVSIDKGQHIAVKQVTLSGEVGVDESAALRALRSTRRKTLLPGIPGVWKGWGLLPDYSEGAVDNDIGILRSFYSKRGYFDADVKVNSTDIRDKGAHVQLGVRSGPLYAIRQFTLDGADGMRQIKPGPDGAFPAQSACTALLADRRNAERAGVLDFSATIEVREVPQPPAAQTDGRKWVDLTATTQRGTAYRVGRIEFSGLHAFRDTTVRRMLLNDEGEPLDEMLLRKTLGRLNHTGMFEPLTESNVLVNTPPHSDIASITISLTEKKSRHWSFSGPAGPMSVGGPLQFTIGSRLPPWGKALFELSTYTVSMHLMLFAKPMQAILPILPNRRFFPELTIRRPPLPGQSYFSGFILAPQFGWKGTLASYGISHVREYFSRALDGERAYTPDLAVTIRHPGLEGQNTMYCQASKTKLDWMRQIGGTAMNVVSAFLPF